MSDFPGIRNLSSLNDLNSLNNLSGLNDLNSLISLKNLLSLIFPSSWHQNDLSWTLNVGWILKNPLFYWFLAPFLLEAVKGAQHQKNKKWWIRHKCAYLINKNLNLYPQQSQITLFALQFAMIYTVLVYLSNVMQEAVLCIYEISSHSCFFLVYSRHDFHCEIQACLWRSCHSCSGKQQEVGRLLIGVFWQDFVWCHFSDCPWPLKSPMTS